MPEEKVETVEIIEQPVAVEEKIDIAELPAEEQEMAKDLGIVPKEEEKKEVESKDEKKTFEEVEKNEKEHLGSYSKSEQAFYFKWKADKKERQTAQAERDLTIVREKSLKNELEKARAEGSLTVGKLDAINKLLNGDPDNITIEAIQGILATAKQEDSKDKPLTRSDLEKMQEEKDAKLRAEAENSQQFVTRMNSLEEFGKTKFDNYDEIIASAKEVIDGKIDLGVIDIKDLARRLVEKVNDKNNDEDDVSDFVLGLAKLNPKYGKTESGKTEKKVSSEDIDKIVKNAAKGSSSAQVSGSNARRVVSYDDLTVEDASKLTPEQWRKLPEGVRRKLLG